MSDAIERQIQQNIDELLVVYEDLGKLTDAYLKDLEARRHKYFTGPDLVKASQMLAALSLIQDNDEKMTIAELEEEAFGDEGYWKAGVGAEICNFIRTTVGKPAAEGEDPEAILADFGISK